MDLSHEVALLETVLFLESGAVSIEHLSKVTGFNDELVKDALSILKTILDSSSHGIELKCLSDGLWILAPKQEFWDILKKSYGRKNEQKLSRAAIETLSIIAYSQPVTRAEVESIRGVSADTMMRFLLDKKFIKELGKKDVPGKPTQYGTTKEFLNFFNLSSIADLPQLDELEQERFKLEQS